MRTVVFRYKPQRPCSTFNYRSSWLGRSQFFRSHPLLPKWTTWVECHRSVHRLGGYCLQMCCCCRHWVYWKWSLDRPDSNPRCRSSRRDRIHFEHFRCNRALCQVQVHTLQGASEHYVRCKQCCHSVAILRGGAGWTMAPQIFAWPPIWTPTVFFLISRLSSFGWHMQGCQMRFVKIPAILSTAPDLSCVVIRKQHRENKDNQYC